MPCLPDHGRIDCTLCHGDQPVVFDRTITGNDSWRITANPLAWGNPKASVLVLGFSKGQTQAGEIARGRHDDIAFKGSRTHAAKILAHVGLMKKSDNKTMARELDRMIADRNGAFHFGSLVRCAVERHDNKLGWTGTNGSILDRFLETDFGAQVTGNCSTRFLSSLPKQTRLVVMFGMGNRGAYVEQARQVIGRARGVEMRRVNEVAYEDDQIVVVHVEHFASRGALIPEWLGEGDYKDAERSRLGVLARRAVDRALSRSRLPEPA